ncbi:IGF1R-like protein, partial [Mya arenaria]
RKHLPCHSLDESRGFIQYPRHLFYRGESIPIVLENSMRASHNITNHILKIILEEVVGYERVEIRTKDAMNATAIMNRISGCPVTGCVADEPPSRPETMVNTEVWMMAGFSRVPWTKYGNIIDLGPLGPFGRLGWFMRSTTVDNLWKDDIIADHWRALNLNAVIRNFTLAESIETVKQLTRVGDSFYCNSADCVEGIYYGPKCNPNNMYTCSTLLASYPEMDMGALKAQVRNLKLPVNIAWIGPHLQHFIHDRVSRQNRPVLFFSWEPNTLTAGKLFTRVKFPLCQNDLTQLPTDCDFGLNQFTKVVWSKVKTSIPEAYHVISKMTFHQDEYIQMLQVRDESVENVACQWVRRNEEVWKTWLPANLSNKTKIYLGGLFPMSGHYWTEPGLVQGGELALDIINKDPTVLPEHELEMIVSNSECLPDVAMKAFIKYITNNTISIAGILVSYGAEASSLSDRQKYPYFYRTIPQVDHHRYVYENFFNAMGWRQVGAISEGGQEFPEYHLLLQDHLQHSGISVVVKRQLVRNYQLNQLDVSQIFADLRAQNVRVIIADFFVFAARAVMCEAWRQRMTAHEGYVWFLPAWYAEDWWDVDYYNSRPNPGDPRPQEHIPCTTNNMEYAIDGHFVLQKTFTNPDNTPVVGGIDIGQYKMFYAKRVGKAALDRVLRRHPGALENIHSNENTQLFVEEITKTNFQGVSGHIQFSGGDRPGNISIVQKFLNETRLVGRYQPGPDNKKGTLEIQTGALRWLTPGGITPSDGNPEVEDCLIEAFRAVLNVSCEMAIVIANVMAFATFALILIAILIFFKLRYDKKVKATHQRMKELGLIGGDFSQCFSLDEWEIPKEKVVLNRKLGEGAFGTVYGGEAQIDEDGWTAVAVKTLKVDSSVQEKVDFLSEAELMKRFQHHNIVSLLGVCTREEPVYTIMEFMLHGDLKTYLLSRRNLVGSLAKEAEDVSAEKLTQMALDVALGLRYLHDLKYVHRDLACRNCLVHSNGSVKIGDFGMTRPTCDTDYYRFNKKVRWMSPESLSDGFFSAKSDVWSYGILIYEIITFGSFPYQGMSNSQVLEFVKNGGRLILPRNCPEKLYNLIYACLEVNMSPRLETDDVIDDLTKNPTLLQPCLNAPTASVVIEEPEICEIPTASCQNTVNQSNVAKFTSLLNRRSFYSSMSQEKLNNVNVKRWSGSNVLKPVLNNKPTIKTFIPVMTGRPRSNSLDSPYDSSFEKQCSKTSYSPSRTRKDKSKRHSEEFTGPSYKWC